MDVIQQLYSRPYYNDYFREFPHYYEIHYTNIDKIDYILIESLQKGFNADQVLEVLDQNWMASIQREADYMVESNEGDTSRQSFFEAYLRSIIHKILVFDDFDRIFRLI